MWYSGHSKPVLWYLTSLTWLGHVAISRLLAKTPIDECVSVTTIDTRNRVVNFELKLLCEIMFSDNPDRGRTKFTGHNPDTARTCSSGWICNVIWALKYGIFCQYKEIRTNSWRNVLSRLEIDRKSMKLQHHLWAWGSGSRQIGFPLETYRVPAWFVMRNEMKCYENLIRLATSETTQVNLSNL